MKEKKNGLDRCRLCGRECEHMAHSHIIPRAFLPNGAKGEHVLIAALSDGNKFKRRDGLYDDYILCDECEHNLITPYDDYGVKILRDKIGVERDGSSKDCLLHVFKDVDRRRLRGFLASLLWRCSVSQIVDCKKMSIGEVYERRIAEDLKSEGSFNYIDAMVFYLRGSIIRDGFMTPARLRFEADIPRVNGYLMQLGEMELRISLDQRPFVIPREIVNVDLPSGRVKSSFSLADDYTDLPLVLPEIPADEGNRRDLLSILATHKKNSSTVARQRA